MTLTAIYLCFWYLGLTVLVVTGSFVLTVLSLNAVNESYMDGESSVMEYHNGRVGSLLQNFLALQWLFFLPAVVNTLLLVFWYQMAIPNARGFLVGVWLLSATMSQMAREVLGVFSLHEMSAIRESKKS